VAVPVSVEQSMSDELEIEFQKADVILSDALNAFERDGVSRYVAGMTLLEIGIAALVKLDEGDHAIHDAVNDLIVKARGFQGSTFPVPRQKA
jgi:hypothetical protein